MIEGAVSTANELLGANPPEKKSRPAWPQGVPLKETYPGSNMFRHPVDKAFVKREEAIRLGAVEPTEAPAPAAVPISQPTPEPQPTPQPQPQPTPQPEAKPDFSDLPGGNGEQQNEPGANPADALKSHRALGEIVHRMIEMLTVLIFGTDFKTDEGERNALVSAWADAFDWWQIRVLNPPERLAAAYSGYFFARMGAIVAWFKRRGEKRRANATGKTVDVETEVTPQPEGSKTEVPKTEPDNGAEFFKAAA